MIHRQFFLQYTTQFLYTLRVLIVFSIVSGRREEADGESGETSGERSGCAVLMEHAHSG